MRPQPTTESRSHARNGSTALHHFPRISRTVTRSFLGGHYASTNDHGESFTRAQAIHRTAAFPGFSPTATPRFSDSHYASTNDHKESLLRRQCNESATPRTRCSGPLPGLFSGRDALSPRQSLSVCKRPRRVVGVTLLVRLSNGLDTSSTRFLYGNSQF